MPGLRDLDPSGLDALPWLRTSVRLNLMEDARPEYVAPGGFAAAPFGHEEVLRGRSKKALREAALVLQAAGIHHAIEVGGDGARILVTSLDGDRARHELSDYSQENAHWPPAKSPTPKLLSNGVAGSVVFAALISVMFWMETRQGYGLDWLGTGRMEAGAVRQGEWWRTVTALTLHVDLSHLVSNLVFGALFAALCAQTLGTGITWLGTLLAGAGGNALETFLVDPTHRAIGASTAIFGTLGLMTAAEWTRRGQTRMPWVRRVAPLFGGAVVFGWFGAGDGSGRVDVLAHATGFLVGGLIGVAVGRLRLPDRTSSLQQSLMAGLSLAAIAMAWVAALDR